MGIVKTKKAKWSGRAGSALLASKLFVLIYDNFSFSKCSDFNDLSDFANLSVQVSTYRISNNFNKTLNSFCLIIKPQTLRLASFNSALLNNFFNNIFALFPGGNLCSETMLS